MMEKIINCNLIIQDDPVYLIELKQINFYLSIADKNTTYIRGRNDTNELAFCFIMRLMISSSCDYNKMFLDILYWPLNANNFIENYEFNSTLLEDQMILQHKDFFIKNIDDFFKKSCVEMIGL